MAVIEFLEALTKQQRFSSQLAEHKYLPPIEPRHRRIDLDDALRAALGADGIERIDDEPMEEPRELGLSDYDFQTTVGNWSGVKSCLATSSQRGEEKLSGAIQVAFKIQTSGEVRESKVVGVSNEDAATVASCVEKQARHIRFPAFDGAEEATKMAKFVF